MMETPKKSTIMFYDTSYDYSTQTSKILTCVTMGTNLKRWTSHQNHRLFLVKVCNQPPVLVDQMREEQESKAIDDNLA